MGKVILGDCMNLETGLPSYPDNFFDLAIVDPPYGIGADKQKASVSPQKGNGNRRRLEWNGSWDNSIPDEKYFSELFRVSKNQVIWGGNYFLDYLKNTSCLLIWDKVQKFHGSDFETAWTSFESSSKIFRYARCLMHHHPNGERRIHPTQKPISLYQWILKNYAKPGQVILDTHLGSGSSRIAAHKMGFDFYGFEIDPDYFSESEKRFKESISMPIFDKQIATQNELF